MTDRPQNPLALILLVCLTTTLTLWSNSAVGETNCSTSKGAEGVCVTKDALRKEATRVAEGMCTEDRVDVKLERDLRQRCEGQLIERPKPVPVVERWQPPLWLTIPLKLAAVGCGAGAGACAGVGCPGEVTAGLAVASFGSTLADVVLELVRRRKPPRS